MVINCFWISTIVIYLIVSLCLFLAKKDSNRSKLVANYHPLFLIIGGIGFVVFTIFETFILSGLYSISNG